jgi:hypothetical protein
MEETGISEKLPPIAQCYLTLNQVHIFDEKTPIVAVTDDGHGMDFEEFLTKWLIVGTDAKVSDSVTPKDDRSFQSASTGLSG